MKENPIQPYESKESKKDLLEQMKSARDTCMVIYGRMMTGDMSIQKAHKILDETFIDSGLMREIENSNVSPELKNTITQILEDPYFILKLANTYELAHRSLENIFIGGLGKIEGESLDFEIESSEDREKISDILRKVRSIVSNEVIDITFKNYLIGKCHQWGGGMAAKIGSTWEKVYLSDGEIKQEENEEEKRLQNGDITQLELHCGMLLKDIKQTILDIKLFLGERSTELPEKVNEILKDILEELKQIITQSLDETNPNVADYVGTDFQGRFAYTGIVEKEYRYRNLLFKKI